LDNLHNIRSFLQVIFFAGNAAEHWSNLQIVFHDFLTIGIGFISGHHINSANYHLELSTINLRLKFPMTIFAPSIYPKFYDKGNSMIRRLAKPSNICARRLTSMECAGFKGSGLMAWQPWYG
jgi:hypothetical protein